MKNKKPGIRSIIRELCNCGYHLQGIMNYTKLSEGEVIEHLTAIGHFKPHKK